MGMSTHVVGVRGSNARHEQLLNIYRVCKEAKVSPPPEVSKYFDNAEGDPMEDDSAGLTVEIKSRKFNAECQDGLEVDLASLPDGIRVIRFVNSY